MSILWGRSHPNPVEELHGEAERLYPVGCHILRDNGSEEYAGCDFTEDRFSFERPLVAAAEPSSYRYPYRPSFGEWLMKMAAAVLIGFVGIATPIAVFLLFTAGDSVSLAIEADRARKESAGQPTVPVLTVQRHSPLPVTRFSSEWAGNFESAFTPIPETPSFTASRKVVR